ncbi:cysteine sulfinic acid decarboxylase isoform X2 [Dasypus novemcinctus]|uniref:cysteine sulfinic acid decarboxylase isoform X2 n=1 Tax=Dasypus novemcinctus TaxID=9361 RepID=UPI00265EEB89|nr:cysteine sulfinic acid decarboxylase isoform X2 [Dasypus novemcinctus]
MEEGGGGPLGLLCPVGRSAKLTLYSEAGRTVVEETLRAIVKRLSGEQKPDWQCVPGPAHTCAFSESARRHGNSLRRRTTGKRSPAPRVPSFQPPAAAPAAPTGRRAPGSAEERARRHWDLPCDFILMADSKPLLSLDGDPRAAEALLQDVFGIVVDEAIRKGTSASEKVCEWKEPEELKQLLDLELRSQGESQERIVERCREVIRYSVKTCHPRFFNQLFSGLDPHALAGRIITETLNTSQYTYEIAPVFVLMEEEVLKKLRALVGWSSGDGVFCPGGSISNMYAMNLARYQRYPDCKQRGLRALPPLALFTSKECHYSIMKGAAFLGLGTDSVRVVKADERGKMIPEDLERQISLAQAEAAWGGSVLLSQTHRHLLDGIQRADSVAWNPHKLLTAGLQCSALLLRDTSNLLKRCHGSQASYLFQQDKFYDVALDTGDKVVQCGRRVDCLKLWLMWKAQGGRGLEQRVDRAFALARYLVEEMKKREGFELVMEPEFVNVCFWFVPPSLKGKQESPDYSERLAKVAPVLKERMVKEGSMMIGYQPHGPRGNFFRVVVANPALTRADMDFLLSELERLGRDL